MGVQGDPHLGQQGAAMAGGLVDEVGGLPNAYPGGRNRLVSAMHRDLPFSLLQGLGLGLGAGYGLGLGGRGWRFGWRRGCFGEWCHGLVVTSAVIAVGSPKI